MIIAHRGNIFGPNPDKENKPCYIDYAIITGYDVEVDVWCLGKDFYLGHDKPTYLVEETFFKEREYNLVCHAKNILALRKLLDIGKIGIHCFMHNNDIAVLTSQNYIWTYPGGHLGKDSIAVMPENNNFDNIKNGHFNYYFNKLGCAGICTDYAVYFKYSI